MPEKDYTGIKFKLYKQSEDNPNHNLLPKLKKHCAELQELNFAPQNKSGSAGNLSFRIAPAKDAFIITCSNTRLRENMPDNDFAVVLNIELEANSVEAVGKRSPSSESLMHGALYRARPEINAIFHGHDAQIIKLGNTTDIPETNKEEAYGTPELVCEILKVPGNPNFVILKNHGFVALGKNMQDAADIVKEVKEKYL